MTVILVAQGTRRTPLEWPEAHYTHTHKSRVTVTVMVTDNLFTHELQKSPALPPSCSDSVLELQASNNF